MPNPFHPELRWHARLLPREIAGDRSLRILRRLDRLTNTRKKPLVAGMEIRDIDLPSGQSMRVYRPLDATSPSAALLWFHGGGFVIGNPRQDEPICIETARSLGIVVAAPTYRLAPEHPFPAALDDGYAALRWLVENAASVGVRADKIAVGGASAGGGLAAGVVLAAHDRKEVAVAFQLLIYPMLDDRTVRRSDIDPAHHRLWSIRSNQFGWRAYLGNQEPGSNDVPPYAAAARRENVAGLPPAWIGVGSLDLFLDEDVSYAGRLEQAGVACELTVIDGAFHGFDAVAPRAAVVRHFQKTYRDALRRALDGNSRY